MCGILHSEIMEVSKRKGPLTTRRNAHDDPMLLLLLWQLRLLRLLLMLLLLWLRLRLLLLTLLLLSLWLRLLLLTLKRWRRLLLLLLLLWLRGGSRVVEDFEIFVQSQFRIFADPSSLTIDLGDELEELEDVLFRRFVSAEAAL